MLKIRIIAVGRVKERYLQEAIAEYVKRLRPYCKLETIELKDEGMEKEAIRMQKYADKNTFIFDAQGRQLDSLEFASFVKAKGESAPITFIIGSAEGISGKLKSQAQLLSLSKMTFTHEMARLFLIEQIYRACMINSGRSYHK